MNAWRRTTKAESRVVELPISDVDDALELCEADPLASILAAAPLEEAKAIGRWSQGGRVWAIRDDRRLTSACWVGANLVPIAIHPDHLRLFVEHACARSRVSSSIVGRSEVTLALWSGLATRWPKPREIRPHQWSMWMDSASGIPSNPHVRRATLADFPLLFPACVAMFTEEIGYSPNERGGGPFYAARVRTLIESERSFVWIDDRGRGPEVIFKAELGAVALGIAQIQGVWVNPDYRGEGLATSAVAAVVEMALRRNARKVSLYVNDFNTRAVATYRSVGFATEGSLATILF